MLGDENGNGSAIYFTGENINIHRLVCIHKKVKKQFEIAKVKKKQLKRLL